MFAFHPSQEYHNIPLAKHVNLSMAAAANTGTEAPTQRTSRAVSGSDQRRSTDSREARQRKGMEAEEWSKKPFLPTRERPGPR